MTLEMLRKRAAGELAGEVGVFCAWPSERERVEGAPFGVLSLESVELRALGFGDACARRGSITFGLSVYARDGDEAESALRGLAARAAASALLCGAKFSAKGGREAKHGLVAADGELKLDALVTLDGEDGEAEVVTLNLRGSVRAGA